MTKEDDVLMVCLTAWRAGTLPQQCAALEVRYITNEFQRVGDFQSLHLSMTAKQASELAEDLRKISDMALQRHDSLDDRLH